MVLRVVRDVLSNSYHARWMGTGGPTSWPPRSPDFSPLDFYLWGHLQTLVYAAPVDKEETLHRTVDACQTIRNYLGIFAWTRRSMSRRALSVMVNILSTYYKCVLSAATHKLFSDTC
jgi:hypothetical protein